MLGYELGEDMGQDNMGAMLWYGLDNMEDTVIGLQLVCELIEGDALCLELGEDMGHVLGCDLGKMEDTVIDLEMGRQRVVFWGVTWVRWMVMSLS